MALRPPVDGASVSQGFGPSTLSVEPAMFYTDRRAWWQAFSGARWSPDFHAALDYPAAEGTSIVASEAGLVVVSEYDGTYGGGNKVQVRIRDGVFYCNNHLSSRAVSAGQRVRRGQLLGRVGHTGAAYGSHDHFWVGIDDEVGSEDWPTLYNPRLFLPGGALADDPRIKPVDTVRHVVLNGAGINIRLAPPQLGDPYNVFATSRADGIYRRGSGQKLSGLGYRFVHLGSRTIDGTTWLIVSGYSGKRLAIARSLAHFD